MNPLDGLRIVTTALNLPGPVACARLRDLGARVTKVEPPAGDPFEHYCAPWYRDLHRDVEVRRLDLKAASDREAMHALLADGDVLVTAQRPSALARLGLDVATLGARHPRLCQVGITGHGPPLEETPGHDLTYLAAHGLLSPPSMPPTLFADMAGAERAVTATLALVIARQRTGRGGSCAVPLEEAAEHLAQPLRRGLTGPRGMLGGNLAGYNLYAARDGWIAVAALEPHFAGRLAAALALPELTHALLRDSFMRETVAHWEALAREHDLPIAAVRTPQLSPTTPP